MQHTKVYQRRIIAAEVGILAAICVFAPGNSIFRINSWFSFAQILYDLYLKYCDNDWMLTVVQVLTNRFTAYILWFLLTVGVKFEGSLTENSTSVHRRKKIDPGGAYDDDNLKYFVTLQILLG